MHTLGYPLQALDGREGDRRRRRRSSTTCARPRSENGIDRKIRFGHRVVRAEWSTADARWTVEAERTDSGETVQLTCGYFWSCTGYYRYDEGYTPEFPGSERFGGRSSTRSTGPRTSTTPASGSS